MGNPSISNNRVRNSVKTINGQSPDINGEITIQTGIPNGIYFTDQDGTSGILNDGVDMRIVTESGNGVMHTRFSPSPDSNQSRMEIQITPGIDGQVASWDALSSSMQWKTPIGVSPDAGNAIVLQPNGIYAPVSNSLLKYHQTIIATSGVEYQIPHSFSTPHVIVQAYDWAAITEGTLIQPANIRVDVSNVWITFSTSSTFIVNILGFYP